MRMMDALRTAKLIALGAAIGAGATYYFLIARKPKVLICLYLDALRTAKLIALGVAIGAGATYFLIASKPKENVRKQEKLSTPQKIEQGEEKSTTIQGNEKISKASCHIIEQQREETSTLVPEIKKKSETSSQIIEQEREKTSTIVPEVRQKAETSYQKIEQREGTSTAVPKNEKEAYTSSRNMVQAGEEISITIKKNEKKEAKRIKHYCSKHHILLVGEGDFSFAACLARAFGSATNVVATSLDSRKTLKSKYSAVEKNLQELKELGCMIVHGVNVHTMTEHPLLQTKLFDRIVFNFPHAGFHGQEHDDSHIRSHKKLVRGFFSSARKMLRKKGQVHVTHKTAHPFDKWQVDILAAEEGLVLIEKAQFKKCDYPGYDNKRGDGPNADDTFPVGEAATLRFRLGQLIA